MKTAISEMLMVNTVKPISLAPFRAAAKGVMPASRWRVMFSITTMASSTTKPVAMVRAISERLSRTVSEQIHHGERADQRHRHGDGWE